MDKKLPNQIISNVRRAQKTIEETRKALSEQLKQQTAVLFKEFFAAHPAVKSIAWTQYTPYFNDGDPCTFRVGEVQLRFGAVPKAVPKVVTESDEVEEIDEEDVEDEDDDDDDGDDEGYCSWTLANAKDSRWIEEAHRPLITPELLEDFKWVTKIVESDPDSMEMIFGDHARVIATKNGITVEEYEHE